MTIGNVAIYLSVWLALACWFSGSWMRNIAIHKPQRERAARRAYASIWLCGSLLMVIHIVASYGVAHQWSHQAAIEATAAESYRVTGIRAGWGVYVNFLFAAVWIAASARAFFKHPKRSIDQALFWPMAAIVFFATVVFEDGLLRIIALAGFVALAVQAYVISADRR